MAENILWTIVLPLLLQEWTQKETELNEKHEGKKKKKSLALQIIKGSSPVGDSR